MEMEGPPSPGETPNKKKRNPSFRRALRKQGMDVPPVVPRTRDPALPPSVNAHTGTRPAKGPIREKTEAEAAAAAAAGETNGTSTANPPVAPATDSQSESLIVVSSSASSSPSPSPTANVSLDISSSPASASSPGATPSPPNAAAESSQSAPEENDADNVVWDPVDPLGLFDELEGPLDWPSEGLFD